MRWCIVVKSRQSRFEVGMRADCTEGDANYASRRELRTSDRTWCGISPFAACDNDMLWDAQCVEVQVGK